MEVKSERLTEKSEKTINSEILIWFSENFLLFTFHVLHKIGLSELDKNLIMQLPNTRYDMILHHNIVGYENDIFKKLGLDIYSSNLISVNLIDFRSWQDLHIQKIPLTLYHLR